MKKIKYNCLILWSLFSVFIVFFICCMPTYTLMKFLGYHDNMYFIWSTIREITLNSEVLHSFFDTMLYKIPEFTMPIAIIVNGANMIFGFINYKKKWWYYLILIISIIMSIMLWDCFQILIHDDDMV